MSLRHERIGYTLSCEELIPLKIQSAFMIDLQQIASSLRLATRRSLLIIDEFGKGTDSSGWSRSSRPQIILTVLPRWGGVGL